MIKTIENEMMKLCSKCGIEKMVTSFYFRNTNQKFRNECIQCCSIKQKEWRDKNHDQIKNHRKQYYEDKKEKTRYQQKKYYDKNRDVIVEKQIENEKNRVNSDIKYRLIRNTRRRIHHALNGRSKSSSTINILGIYINTYKR